MIKVKDLDTFINYAYTGNTLLQLDLPGKFMLTVYKHYQKEAITYKYDTGKYVRWMWFEIDY